MSNLGLDEKHYNFVLSLLKRYLPQASFYVFGSRANGTYSKYSDIDIAIDNKEKISLNTLAKLNSEFEKSLLPFEVDIIDLYSISEEFKSNIESELIKL